MSLLEALLVIPQALWAVISAPGVVALVGALACVLSLAATYAYLFVEDKPRPSRWWALLSLLIAWLGAALLIWAVNSSSPFVWAA
ncbi:DUF308 domain-containing protein [Microbacterium sp. zg-YB36]|uniref:DUF308 domain-containing protein n=1 Tax=Microbacterium sp. zg-YB36 TaxID=2969407 RepID=UPI00214AEC53|nr:DUF308 domain-containing protein [Microbacterium sp. zg-YB36]MDL5351190.1 DUF308 domain-containing protein [Microbacterium sp. zg-YB36]